MYLTAINKLTLFEPLWVIRSGINGEKTKKDAVCRVSDNHKKSGSMAGLDVNGHWRWGVFGLQICEHVHSACIQHTIPGVFSIQQVYSAYHTRCIQHTIPGVFSIQQVYSAYHTRCIQHTIPGVFSIPESTLNIVCWKGVLCLHGISDASGMVKFWHYPSSSCLHTIHEDRQTLAAAFNPIGGRFITGGANAIIQLYDADTKTAIRSLQPRWGLATQGAYCKVKHVCRELASCRSLQHVELFPSESFQCCTMMVASCLLFGGGSNYWAGCVMFF